MYFSRRDPGSAVETPYLDTMARVKSFIEIDVERGGPVNGNEVLHIMPFC